MKVSASFLSCSKIIPVVSKLSATDVDYIHVDFIDGSFVKGKKIPFRKIKQIGKYSRKRLDVHLMTKRLKKYIKKFSQLDCEYITFHLEIGKNIEKYIELIHSYGIKCGLAINPDTDFKELEPYLNMIDMVLVMSVVPGYGGQEFIKETVKKVKSLREYIGKKEVSVMISVDGGINEETVKKVKTYVDMVVSGSYITKSDDFQEQIHSLR